LSAKTKSSGTGIAFRTSRPGPIRTIAGIPVSTGEGLSPVFTNPGNLDVLNRFGEKFRSTGVDIGPGEVHELEVFDYFLENHVQPNRICDVQCMLLWNEWIRHFRSHVSGFPKLIHEKEFRGVITDRFNIEILNNGARGLIYPGIKFVR